MENQALEHQDSMVIKMGVTKVRIGNGKKVHVAGRCGSWRVGRSIGVIEDQDVAITCKDCLGEREYNQVQSEQEPIGTTVVVGNAERRRVKDAQYAERIIVRVNGDSYAFIRARFNGDNHITYRQLKWNEERGKLEYSGITFTGKLGGNARNDFRTHFGHTPKN